MLVSSPEIQLFLVLLVLTLKLGLGHHHLARYLQRVVKASQHIARTELPSVEEIYVQCCREKLHGTMADLNSRFSSINLVALKLNEFGTKATKMICS